MGELWLSYTARGAADKYGLGQATLAPLVTPRMCRSTDLIPHIRAVKGGRADAMMVGTFGGFNLFANYLGTAENNRPSASTLIPPKSLDVDTSQASMLIPPESLDVDACQEY